MTKITAHRGDVERYRENTMPAFIGAVERGADRIELDIHATLDGQIIVHHDYRTSPVSGSSDKALICRQTFGSIRLHSPHIPLLSEVFDTLGNSVEYEIELKGFTEEFLGEALRICRDYSLVEKIEFTSPHQFLFSVLGQIDAGITTGLIVDAFPEWMGDDLGLDIVMSNLILGRYNVLHCPFEMLSGMLVERLHSSGYLVHAANVNNVEQLREVYRLKVDQLSTDKLSLAQSIRSE